MAKRIARGVGIINDFPDDVLSHIISFLPFKEAVRTSILSTRWRCLFSFISSLNLEVNTGNVEEWKQFLNSVDRLMLHFDMPSMVKFHLRCGGSIFGNKKKCAGFLQRVGGWICAVIRHKIQELDIKIKCGVHNWSFLPPNLFSCESLVVLKLNLHCREENMQKVSDRIWLPKLKIIHLEGTHFSSDGSLGNLFTGCPVLEDLVLNGCWFLGGSVRFSISNQNLKTLTLKDISSQGESTRILINAPSLVILNHHVSISYSLEFLDVNSLSEAIITSYPSTPIEFYTTTPAAVIWMQNIETLRICFSIVRDLQHSKVPIPLFEKMTYLKIWFQECCFDTIGFHPIGLEYFLARCVVLETLVFEESQMLYLRRTNKRYSLQESQLAPLLHHLKTIEIRLLDIGHVIVLMKVIKFFLKSAKVLEVLKISSKQGHPEEQFKITTTLTNYTKASKKCRVLFFSDTSK